MVPCHDHTLLLNPFYFIKSYILLKILGNILKPHHLVLPWQTVWLSHLIIRHALCDIEKAEELVNWGRNEKFYVTNKGFAYLIMPEVEKLQNS